MIEEKQIFKISRKIWPDYRRYAERIEKSLYYGKLSAKHKTSLPVTGLMVEKFGLLCKQDSLDYLEQHSASSICYDACVTPCSVIVALLYLDRLSKNNPDYLASTSSSHVFVVALMVASKFLYDDGEDDEVFNDEWATSAAMMVHELNKEELRFLDAMEWNLFVDANSFMRTLIYMEAEVAKREGDRRGFLTYTDMVSISHRLPSVWNALINVVGSAFALCIFSYTATIVCVVASVSIAGSVSMRLPEFRFGSEISSCVPSTTSRISNSSNENDIETFETIVQDVEDEENADFNGSIATINKDAMNLSAESFESRAGIPPGIPPRRRFHAISAFTTALLFASSPVNGQTVHSPHGFLHSPNIDHPMSDVENLLSLPLRDDLTSKIKENGNNPSLLTSFNSCIYCQNSLAKSAALDEQIYSTRKIKMSWSERRKLRQAKKQENLRTDEPMVQGTLEDDLVLDIGHCGTSTLNYDTSFGINQSSDCSSSSRYSTCLSYFGISTLELPDKFCGDGQYCWNCYLGVRVSTYPTIKTIACTNLFNSKPCVGLGGNSEPLVNLADEFKLSDNSLFYSETPVNPARESDPCYASAHTNDAPADLAHTSEDHIGFVYDSDTNILRDKFLHDAGFDIFNGTKTHSDRENIGLGSLLILDKNFVDINLALNVEKVFSLLIYHFLIPFQCYRSYLHQLALELTSPFTVSVMA